MTIKNSRREQADFSKVSSRQKSPNTGHRPRRINLLLICLALWPRLLISQTNAPTVTYPSNRYLLVVETSRSMQRRADALTHTVQDLLGSAMSVQARRGDTLGVWTFDQDVHTGLLPLQRLSPETQKLVTDRVVGFLRSQKFENRAAFDKLVPALNRVATNSAFITFVLVYMGEDQIHGTPFDQRINDFIQTWRQQQKDAATPFVIALRAQQGKFVDCSMSPSLWPTELPALPKELFIPMPPAHSLTAQPRKPVVPPLIVHGQKPDASSRVKNQPTLATNTLTASNTNLAAPLTAEPTSTTSNPTNASPPAVAKTELSSDTVTNPTSASVETANLANSGLNGGSQSKLKDSATSSATEQHFESQTNAPTSPAGQAAFDRDQQVKPNRSTSPGRTAEVATTAAPSSARHPMILYSIGFAALCVSVVGIWLWKSRSRPVRETSLITESIDRGDS